MKGSIRVLPLVILLVIVLTTLVVADEYMLAPTKTISTGTGVVKFDGIVYRFFTERSVNVTFSRIDYRWVRLQIKPIDNLVLPYCDVTVQWLTFPPVDLPLGAAGTNDYSLDTETGYAEK